MSSIAMQGDVLLEKELLAAQMLLVGMVVFSGFVVYVISYFFPGFFKYPYFAWGGWGAVERFWPAFIWAACATSVLAVRRAPVYLHIKNQKFLHWIPISFLVGVCEELGYRCLFICFAMIGIMWANFVLGFITFLPWLFFVVAIVVGIEKSASNESFSQCY